MDPKNVSAEELAAEQAALQESKEDEIRSKIVEEFGFDTEADKERIDKLVAKELDHSKKLSSAIGQKIKWRSEATKPKEPAQPPAQQQQPKAEDVSKLVAEQLEQRDLDGMEYPDNIKAEIKRIAQITGKTVKQAERDPYIVSTLIDPWKDENKIEAATISRTNRASGKSSKTFDINNPPELDNSSPEALRKSEQKYEEWKKEAMKNGY